MDSSTYIILILVYTGLSVLFLVFKGQMSDGSAMAWSIIIVFILPGYIVTHPWLNAGIIASVTIIVYVTAKLAKRAALKT